MYQRVCCVILGPFHTDLSLQLGLLCTVIRHENGLEMAVSVHGKHSKTELVEHDEIMLIMWLPCPSFRINEFKMTADCYAVRFLRRSVNVNYI